MFFESILEEVNIDEPVSESTMEEIRQLSIPNFMESALSPFDLVDKGIYENAKAYNDMVSKIGKIELDYLRENGEEPVWEASDHQSIFARFIAGIKHIIQVIAGAFQKLIAAIDRKVNEHYEKLGSNFVDQVQAVISRNASLKDKKYKLINYQPQIGMDLLHKAENIQGNINKVESYKKAWAYVYSSKRDGSDIENVKENAVDSLRKVLFDNSAIDSSKMGSNASARDALRNAMCPERAECSFNQAMVYVKAFNADPRAQQLKAGLKSTYQKINKVLGKHIDVAKALQKSIDSKKEPVPSQVTGSIVSALNAYSSMVTSIYNETVRCASKRWAQSCSLVVKITKDAKGVLKNADKADKAAQKSADDAVKKSKKENK